MNKPILFSAPMVQAIMNGTKTQTRRIIKSKYGFFVPDKSPFYPIKGQKLWPVDEKDDNWMNCPYGKIGDILWVRETHFKNGDEFIYRADGECCEQFEQCECLEIGKPKWKPSIFMPKSACRIFLKITNVRVERLYAITNEDARDEGMEKGIYMEGPNTEKGEFQLQLNEHAGYIDGFRYEWQNINGRESWNSNPWVWVVEFEKCDKPENWLN